MQQCNREIQRLLVKVGLKKDAMQQRNRYILTDTPEKKRLKSAFLGMQQRNRDISTYYPEKGVVGVELWF